MKDLFEMLADQMGRTKPTYVLLLLVCMVLYFHLTFATHGEVRAVGDQITQQHMELQRQLTRNHDEVLKLETMFIMVHPEAREVMRNMAGGGGAGGSP
jgi:hypothetical protein